MIKMVIASIVNIATIMKVINVGKVVQMAVITIPINHIIIMEVGNVSLDAETNISIGMKEDIIFVIKKSNAH